MTFTQEEILQLIKDSQSPYWRIKDMNGNCLFYNSTLKDLGKSTAMLKQKLEQFSGYAEVEVWAGNESVKNASFKGCQKWTLTNSFAAPAAVGTPGTVPGMISEQHLATALSLANLTAKTEMDLYKMKMKYENNKNQLIPDKYIPFICKALGMSNEEIINLGKLSMASSTPTALAGSEVDQDIQIKEIEDLMEKVTDKDSVGLENMVTILKGLDENPELGEQAVNLINLQNGT